MDRQRRRRKIACYEADSELDEAAHVAEVIGRNVKNGAKLRDHAIYTA